MRQRLGITIGVLLMAGLFAFGGLMSYRAQRDGVRTTATIITCTERPAKLGGDICEGRWVIGEPAFGDGRFVQGTVEGATSGDEGKRIEVRANGDRAVVPGMRVAIVLWTLAGLTLAFGAYLLLRKEPEQTPGRISP